MSEDTGAAEQSVADQLDIVIRVSEKIGSPFVQLSKRLTVACRDLLASQARELEELRRIVFYDGARGVQPIIDERDALRQQLAEAQKDAQRIDYLAQHPRAAEIILDGESIDCYVYAVSGHTKWTLREIIDAALVASEQGEREGKG